MVIGRSKSTLHKTNSSVKTTYSSHRNLYSMNNVGEIKFGDNYIHQRKDKFGMYGIFMDSGSTLTYFPRENYLKFKNMLISNCALHR